MTPTLQTRPHPDGDCTRACIAGILDLPIEQVPDFTEIPGALEREETGYPRWYLFMQKWLAEQGFEFIEIPIGGRRWNPIPFELVAILIGEHVSGCRHSIVGKCEGESFMPIFDPLGTNPFESFKDKTIQSVCFLVPIDPSLQHRLGASVDKMLRLSGQLPQDHEIVKAIRQIAMQALNIPEDEPPSLMILPDGSKPIRGVTTTKINGHDRNPFHKDKPGEDARS